MATHAFVISTAEEEVVNAVAIEGQLPAMDGSLFQFRTDDMPAYLDRVGKYAADQDDEDTYVAALRLQERLGSWIGQNIVAEKVEPTPVAPAKTKAANPVSDTKET